MSGKPRLLDLFCGAGGCSVGYARAGFEVVGVDINPQPNYPSHLRIGDALQVMDSLLTGGSVCAYGLDEFDAVHASPPCQVFSAVTGKHRDKHEDLLTPTRELLIETGLPYVIENVPGAPLINPIQLCGGSFGLGVRRHRLFECSFPLQSLVPPCNHNLPAKYEVYEHGRWYMSPFAKVYGSGGGKAIEHWGEAMGIDWMTRDELAQAIPPAYTEFIGTQLLQHLESELVTTPPHKREDV